MSGIHFYTIFSGVYGNRHPIVRSKLHLIEAQWYSRELPKISFRIPSNAIAFRGMISILFCCLTTRIRQLTIGRFRERDPVSVYGRLIDTKWNSFTTQQRKWQDEMKEKVFFPKSNFLCCAFVVIPNRLIAGLIQFQFSVMIWLLSVPT